MRDGAPADRRLAAAALFLLAAGLAAAAVSLADSGFFVPRYSFYTDVLNLYWIPRLRDAAFSDPFLALMRRNLSAFSSEWPLIWLTGLFAGTRPFTLGLKALGVLLCGVSALLAAAIASRKFGRGAAAAAAVVFTVEFLSMDTFQGVNRAYGLVLILAAAAGAENRRYWLFPAAAAAAALLYPSIGVTLFLSGLFLPLFFREDFSGRRAAGYYALLALSLGAAWLAKEHSVFLKGITGALSSGNYQNSKLTQFVSAPVNPASPKDILFHFILNLNEHGRAYAAATGLLAAVAAWGLAVKRAAPLRLVPRTVVLLFSGAAAAFVPLYLIHPVSASRQLIFTLPLLLVFLASASLKSLFPAGFSFRNAALPGALVSLSLSLFLPQVTDFTPYRPGYSRLAEAPAGSVVASDPAGDFAAGLEVFSPARPYLSDQLDDLYIFTYGRQAFEERRAGLLKALYASSPCPMLELAADRGIDYAAVQEDRYSEDFFARVRRSSFPEDVPVREALAAEKDPRGFLRFARAHPAFSWKNGSGKFLLVDLKTPAALKAGTACRRAKPAAGGGR